MKTSTSIAAIAAALAKAQGEIKNAGRDAANPFFKSKYAPLDTVIDNLKPALSRNGIAYYQSGTSDGPKVSLVTLLMHSSGEWIEGDPLTATGKDAGAQTVGSVCTYLRRYGLMAAVGIAATDDDDAEAGEGRPEYRETPVMQPASKPTNAQSVKAKVAAASKPAVDMLPAAIEAYKAEAFKEASRLHGGDKAKAAAYLCEIRKDPAASRPWDTKDCELVKRSLALLGGQANASRAESAA